MSTKKNKKATAKPILQESVVKRWGRIARLTENAGFEQKLEEMYPMAEEEEEMEDELPMGGGAEEEMPPMEEPELGGEEGGMGDEALVQDIVSAVADAISGVTGVEVSVSGAEGEMGDEVGGELEPDMGGMDDEMGMGDEMEDEEPMMEGDDKLSTISPQTRDFSGGKPVPGGNVTEGEELDEEDGEKLEEEDDKLSTISPQTRDFSGGTPVPGGNVTEAKKRRAAAKKRSALVNEVVKRVVARLKKAKK